MIKSTGVGEQLLLDREQWDRESHEQNKEGHSR